MPKLRRALSLVFYILAGWWLTALPMMASIPFPSADFMTYGLGAAFILGMFLVPLGLAALLDPGIRSKGVGITLIVAAFFGTGTLLGILFAIQDPLLAKFMPPDGVELLGQFRWQWGGLAGLLMGSTGWLLWKRSDANTPAPE